MSCNKTLVLSALNTFRGGFTKECVVSELAEYNIPDATIGRYLRELYSEGKLIRLKRGVYYKRRY